MKKKEEIIKLHIEGLNNHQISLKVGCAYSYVRTIVELYKLRELVKEQK